MNPVIESVSDDLFETGSITVNGSGFNSSCTKLLINGLSSDIKIISDSMIKAAIPVLNETKIYDIRVMTVSRYDGIKYSNSFSSVISSIDSNSINLRTVN